MWIFNKEHLVKIFISELKKKRPIILEEFLYSSKNMLKLMVKYSILIDVKNTVKIAILKIP